MGIGRILLKHVVGVDESFLKNMDQAKAARDHDNKQLGEIEKILLGHNEDITKLKYNECWSAYTWLNNFLVKHNVPTPTSGAMCTVKLDSMRMWSLHEALKWLFERAPKREKVYLDMKEKLAHSDKRVKHAHVRIQDAEQAGEIEVRSTQQTYADKLQKMTGRCTELERENNAMGQQLKNRNMEISILKKELKELKGG